MSSAPFPILAARAKRLSMREIERPLLLVIAAALAFGLIGAALLALWLGGAG